MKTLENGKRETKRQRIIEMFNSIEWVMDLDGRSRVKVITYDLIKDAGFQPTWEYGEKYNDVAYIQRVIKSMGYRCLVGAVIGVWETDVTKLNQKP